MQLWRGFSCQFLSLRAMVNSSLHSSKCQWPNLPILLHSCRRQTMTKELSSAMRWLMFWVVVVVVRTLCWEMFRLTHLRSTNNHYNRVIQRNHRFSLIRAPLLERLKRTKWTRSWMVQMLMGPSKFQVMFQWLTKIRYQLVHNRNSTRYGLT